MPTPSRTQTSSDSFWTAPNRHGNGSTVRSVIIKLRNCVDDYMQLYFMLADCRPSARNHLSLADDDDCRAGQTPPWVVASLFLPPLPWRDIPQKKFWFMQHAEKMKENPHERAHHATTLTTTTTDERTDERINVTVHLCFYSIFLLLFVSLCV